MVEIYTAEELCAELGICFSTLKGKISKREITKIDRGLYVKGQLGALGWIQALQERNPEWVLSGLSAYQYHTHTEITFPLRFRTRRPAKNRSTENFIVTAHRHHHVTSAGQINVVTPLLAAWEARNTISAEAVARFLEQQYSRKEGKQRLETDLVWLGKVPAELSRYLGTLSIGADSNLERRFFAALQRRGLDFSQNVYLDGYFWDFQSKKLKRLLIEIGAHQYHRDLSTVQGEASYIRDVWKHNQAILKGYVVLQFTAKCIDTEMERCLDMVEDAMNVLRGKPTRKWAPPWKWHSWLLAHNRFRR